MSVLGGSALKARLKHPNFKQKLVIRPLLEPDSQMKDGQASVDIRLGFEFGLISPSSFAAIDEFSDDAAALPDPSSFRKEYVPFGASISIHPHQLILATSLEYIRLPIDLMAYVVGRSTWGRLGLINATAVGIHPGFSGTLTLELRNLGETPLVLYPGQTIGQLFFHEVKHETSLDEIEIVSGQYGGSVNILPRHISSKETRAKLLKLIAKFAASGSP